MIKFIKVILVVALFAFAGIASATCSLSVVDGVKTFTCGVGADAPTPSVFPSCANGSPWPYCDLTGAPPACGTQGNCVNSYFNGMIGKGIWECQNPINGEGVTCPTVALPSATCKVGAVRVRPDQQGTLEYCSMSPSQGPVWAHLADCPAGSVGIEGASGSPKHFGKGEGVVSCSYPVPTVPPQ